MGTNFKNRKFHLNSRKQFFIVRVVEYWRRLYREVVESPSVETGVFYYFSFNLPFLCMSLIYKIHIDGVFKSV